MSASDTELIQTEEGELDAEDDVSWKGGEYYDPSGGMDVRSSVSSSWFDTDCSSVDAVQTYSVADFATTEDDSGRTLVLFKGKGTVRLVKTYFFK